MKDSQNKTQSIETSVIVRLARKVGITANAKYIYGEPVERDGVTVITVGKVVYGFGGGSGEKDKQGGFGGGGGVAVAPVGYIEIKNGETRFRPIHDWISLIPILSVSAPVLLLAAWGMMRFLGLKKAVEKPKV